MTVIQWVLLAKTMQTVSVTTTFFVLFQFDPILFSVSFPGEVDTRFSFCAIASLKLMVGLINLNKRFLIEQFSIKCRRNLAIALVLHYYVLWFKTLVPLSRLTRSKTKTNCDLRARIFLCLALVTCICLSFDWFIALHMPAVIGQSDYFGFGFTTLN